MIEHIFAIRDDGGLEECRERVVRCRDCAFFENGWCTQLEFVHSDMEDGFCAWGVPKEGGE